MNKISLIIFLLSFVLLCCKNTANDSLGRREKELLYKEKELLYKEKELMKMEKELIVKENELTNQLYNSNNSDNNKDSYKAPKIDKNYIIKNNAAGIIKIGNYIPFPNFSDDYTIIKSSQVRMTEEGPFEEPVYIFSQQGKEMLNLLLKYDNNTERYTENIGEIIVLSDKYKTSKGIGVNSSIEEFIVKYPKYKIWYTYVSGMYVIECSDLNVQFILNEKDFIGKLNITDIMTNLKLSDFKRGSKIMKIRIIKSVG
jgi:hypothetical protein